MTIGSNCCTHRSVGLVTLLFLVVVLAVGISIDYISATAIADRGLKLLSATFVFSVLVTLVLYVAGRLSNAKDSSFKANVTGNLIHDWWFGIQLNPQFMGIDLKKQSMLTEKIGKMYSFYFNMARITPSDQARGRIVAEAFEEDVVV